MCMAGMWTPVLLRLARHALRTSRLSSGSALSGRLLDPACLDPSYLYPSHHSAAIMNLAHDHEWNVSTGEAKAIQKRLSPEVAVQPLSETYDRPVETVAGVDVSVKGDVAKAAVSVLHLDDLGVIEEVTHRCETPFPYVPGLLSFREMPAVLPALEKLGALPDVLITDSQGYAHPRRFGLACHLGVVLDHPAFGVAKSLLTGSPSANLPAEKGSRVPLVDDGETVGAAVRTRSGVNPVYVSVGHRIMLDEAVDLTLRCCPTYKLPETTRAAHRLSQIDGE